MISFDRDLTYVGRAIEVGKMGIQVKFMKRKPGSLYDWPQTDQLEEVLPLQFICGPISIQGSVPFKIEWAEKAGKD